MLVHGVDVWAEPLRAKALLRVLPDGLRTFDRLNGLELVTYSGLLRGLERDVVVPRATELVKVLGLWDAGTALVADSKLKIARFSAWRVAVADFGTEDTPS